jgi:hypothetical protein
MARARVSDDKSFKNIEHFKKGADIRRGSWSRAAQRGQNMRQLWGRTARAFVGLGAHSKQLSGFPPVGEHLSISRASGGGLSVGLSVGLSLPLRFHLPAIEAHDRIVVRTWRMSMRAAGVRWVSP